SPGHAVFLAYPVRHRERATAPYCRELTDWRVQFCDFRVWRMPLVDVPTWIDTIVADGFIDLVTEQVHSGNRDIAVARRVSRVQGDVRLRFADEWTGMSRWARQPQIAACDQKRGCEQCAGDPNAIHRGNALPSL